MNSATTDGRGASCIQDMAGLSFVRATLRSFLCTSPTNSKMKVEPLAMKGFRTSGDAVELLEGWKLSSIAEIISVLCMKTAMVFAGCYFVFVSYVAVAHTHNWAERLRLLPLLFLALTVPLLGKVVMIREQRQSCG